MSKSRHQVAEISKDAEAGKHKKYPEKPKDPKPDTGSSQSSPPDTSSDTDPIPDPLPASDSDPDSDPDPDSDSDSDQGGSDKPADQAGPSSPEKPGEKTSDSDTRKDFDSNLSPGDLDKALIDSDDFSEWVETEDDDPNNDTQGQEGKNSYRTQKMKAKIATLSSRYSQYNPQIDNLYAANAIYHVYRTDSLLPALSPGRYENEVFQTAIKIENALQLDAFKKALYFKLPNYSSILQIKNIWHLDFFLFLLRSDQLADRKFTDRLSEVRNSDTYLAFRDISDFLNFHPDIFPSETKNLLTEEAFEISSRKQRQALRMLLTKVKAEGRSVLPDPLIKSVSEIRSSVDYENFLIKIQSVYRLPVSAFDDSGNLLGLQGMITSLQSIGEPYKGELPKVTNQYAAQVLLFFHSGQFSVPPNTALSIGTRINTPFQAEACRLTLVKENSFSEWVLKTRKSYQADFVSYAYLYGFNDSLEDVESVQHIQTYLAFMDVATLYMADKKSGYSGYKVAIDSSLQVKNRFQRLAVRWLTEKISKSDKALDIQLFRDALGITTHSKLIEFVRANS